MRDTTEERGERQKGDKEEGVIETERASFFLTRVRFTSATSTTDTFEVRCGVRSQRY